MSLHISGKNHDFFIHRIKDENLVKSSTVQENLLVIGLLRLLIGVENPETRVVQVLHIKVKFSMMDLL